jgi:hypothetical protein
MQPGKVKRGDILFLVSAIVVVAAVVIAVFATIR